jgi:hypothetical protein
MKRLVREGSFSGLLLLKFVNDFIDHLPMAFVFLQDSDCFGREAIGAGVILTEIGLSLSRKLKATIKGTFTLFFHAIILLVDTPEN